VIALRRRVAFAQNFFRHPRTAKDLVSLSGIAPGDRVYDLGAGSGAITRALVEAGAHVVAVEHDANLAVKLRRRFALAPVTVVESDVCDIRFSTPFKVVANIPFNRTAAAMRKLFFDVAAPQMAQLVLQREAAEKYAGAGRMTAVSLMLKPWFALEIVRTLDADEFVPRPQVTVAVLRVLQRPAPLLPLMERDAWNGFVRYALGRSRREARQTFRNLVSNLQWKLLARDLNIPPDAPLAALTLDQWLGIYRFARRCMPAHKARRLFADAV
jgi:23S rRNA (adenine-N6)-dimethyltransferase